MRCGSRPLAAVLTASLLSVACGAPGSPGGSSVEPSSLGSAAATAAASPMPAEQTPSFAPPTERPLSTVAPIPSSDSFGSGLLYTCAGGAAAFPIELLETPPSSNLNPDPTPALIRWPVPTTADAWWLLARTDTHAEYVGRDSGQGFYESAMLERDAAGTWNAVGWGGCSFYAFVPGPGETDVLGWWIRAQDWPEPDDRTLHIRVRTWCPQTLAERMLEPTVRYGSDRIIAIVAARALGEEWSACGREQVADGTIELDEPVGYRLVLDGVRWPGRDAHTKTEEMGICCG